MFSWMAHAKPRECGYFENVSDGLRALYKTKLLPLEKTYRFEDFHSAPLDDADFNSKPMIVLVGQYSTGKTTFIKYLLERDFPGMRIGPEPTTDSFLVVMYDENEGIVPGNALVSDPVKPFRALVKYGNAFLNKFQCSKVNSPVLKHLTIVDTPGVLSGEKDRINRGYDYGAVLEWFTNKADRIIFLFDAHKLDISDELCTLLYTLRGQDEKIRTVLNKADALNCQQLMRVYGGLMWSIGKVLQTPEMIRVYVGSFWNEPLKRTDHRKFFESEEDELFRDLFELPQNVALRKLSDLMKRARLAKVHAFVTSTLYKERPRWFKKSDKKKNLISQLDSVYQTVQRKHGVPPGDFPDSKKMADILTGYDFDKLKHLKPKLLETVDKMLNEDIPKVMALIPKERLIEEQKFQSQMIEMNEKLGPFGFMKGEGADAGHGDPGWIVDKNRHQFDSVFDSLESVDGKISGETARQEMIKSKLPNSVLGKIWKISDVDCDNFLDRDEFALAMYLIQVKLDGHDIPTSLPSHLVPPSKRKSNCKLPVGSE